MYVLRNTRFAIQASICAFILFVAAAPIAAGPVISEFLALNESDLQDQDGDFSDWIEIFNPGPGAVDLDGWRLTDQATVPGKWSFPAVTLPPGEFLIVFASGKNRALAGSELHTNFQLDSDGEYLALVRPDALTVEHAYSPEFPKQEVDVSYGLKQTVTTLVSVGDTATYHVPDASDAAVDFTPIGFDDASWTTGTSGFGFGVVIPTNGLQAHWTFDTDATDSAGTNHGTPINGASITADAVAGAGALALDGVNDCVTLGDPASLQIIGQITIACWVKVQATNGLRNIVAKGHTTNPNGELQLRINNGQYQFGSWGGAGGGVTGTGIMATVGVWEHIAGTFDGTNWNFYLNGELKVSTAGGTGAIFVNEGWAIGARGTGTDRFFGGSIDDVFIYDRGLTPAEVAILSGAMPSGAETAVNAEMLGTNSSLWLRHEFNVADPTAFDLLQLKVKYEDGYVAWLNGVEVARGNAPTPLLWNSTAATDRLDSLSNSFESVSITDHLPALATGPNVLAIQALNDGVNDGNFLIAAELLPSDLSTEERYFDPATPLSPNGDGFIGFVEDVTFSRERGFFDTPFALTLSTTTSGSQIRYTQDGSQPTAANGTIYNAPLTISQTTPLRAAAFLPGWQASPTGTNTYIFLDDVIASSVMDTAITQDPVYGPQMRQALTDLPTISIVDPSYRLEESVRTGPYPEWTYHEFPISFEYLTPDGSLMLQEDAGAGRYGGHWYDRSGATYPWDKWSYRIYFRKEYGAATLKAPLFEGFDNGIPPVETFDHLEIRSGSHDMSQRGFYMSGALTADTMLEMGNINPHSRFVHVYINGTYWGQYNLHERFNADMVSRYAGGEKEDYEAVKANNTGGNFGPAEPYDGNGSVWAHALTLKNSYEDIKTWVDIKSYVDFMLMFLFGRSESEFRAAGSISEDGAGFLFWLRDPDGFTRSSSRSTNSGPGNIFSSLLSEAHPDFKMFLADRIHEHFFNGGGLTEAAMTEKLLRRCNEVGVAFYGEAARWGYLTPTAWANKRDSYINNVLSVRPDAFLGQLRSAGYYPAVDAPVFQINGSYQHGGVISDSDALTMNNPNATGTIYYTLDGSDPRQASGVAAPGATLYTAAVALTQSARVRAVVLDGLDWSAANDAVFTVPTPVGPGALALTELHYNPLPPTPTELAVNPLFTKSDFEFIELQNRTTATLDLSGVTFTNGITFTFPAPSILKPNEYAILARNRQAFEARYGLGAKIMSGASGYLGKLNNNGETLRLENPTAQVILQFEYNDARGWSLAADGGGHSLVPLDRTLTAEPDLLFYGRNWRPSAYIGGSPGAADPSPPSGVVINELTVHTDTGQPAPNDSNDWIELYNPTASPITLNEYYLSDDITSLTKWAIPNGTLIPALGRIVLDEENDFHNPRTQGFGLNKAGEQLILSHLPGSAIDRVVDSVRFKGQENGSSLGRLPDGDQTPNGSFWHPLTPTRNAPNAGNQLGVVFNEVMYHSADNTSTSEYIELINPSPTSAALWNSVGPWRIRGGVSFTFPPGAMIPGDGRLLIVPFDPTVPGAFDAFKAAHGLTEVGSALLGPYTWSLSNRGERIALERPQAPDLVGDNNSWVIADELIYFDQNPFPDAADGRGSSLHRVSVTRSGNDPANWVALPPKPGFTDNMLRVVNQAVSGVAPTSANLNGEIISTPGENPEVHIYWGTADGDQDPAGWDHDENLGVLGAGLFTLPIIGLTPGGQYYYRSFAQTSSESLWASETVGFITGIIYYTITTTATNGTVEKTPTRFQYAHGTQVTLTPNPSPGYLFAGWTGDVPVGHETDNPLVLTIDAAKTLTPIFQKIPGKTATQVWVLY